MKREELKSVTDQNIKEYWKMIESISITFFVVFFMFGVFTYNSVSLYIAVLIMSSVWGISFIIALVAYICVHLKNNLIAQSAILATIQKDQEK